MTSLAPPFDLLLESGPVLAVNKPAGLLTQAPPGIDSLEARIKDWIKRRDAKPGNVYLGVPHRLDRPVTGAIAFARHVRAARRISEQFEGRLVRKVYWACVEGRVPRPQGTWIDYVEKTPEQAQATIAAAEGPSARRAVLHYRLLGECSRGSWLEIELETGRYHQIRVQAASRGLPVVGDRQYGAASGFGPPLDDPRMRPIALHARRLEFLHPMTQVRLEITAPLGEAWRGLDLEGIDLT